MPRIAGHMIAPPTAISARAAISRLDVGASAAERREQAKIAAPMKKSRCGARTCRPGGRR